MTIRWGILGCGDVARRRVAGAIQQDAESELLAACRRNSEALQQFCGEFGVPRGYSDEVDLIADPDIDAVYIATPVDRHLPQTLACAGVGKHVLCEKPMAVSLGEADHMVDICKTQDTKLALAHQRRFAEVANDRRRNGAVLVADRRAHAIGDVRVWVREVTTFRIHNRRFGLVEPVHRVEEVAPLG